MTSTKLHDEWALSHFESGVKLLEVKEYSWAVVALFYSGLHIIHSVLPTMNHLGVAQQHPESHGGTSYGSEGTNVIVRRYVQSIDLPYRSLYDASIDVRYNGKKNSKLEAAQHRSQDLRLIATWACTQLHQPDCSCWLTTV